MTKFIFRKIALDWDFGIAFSLGVVCFSIRICPVISSTSISGRVIDAQGLPVGEAEVLLLINGTEETDFHTQTNHDGVYLLDFSAKNVISLDLEIDHPHFTTHIWSASDEEIGYIEDGAAIRVPDIQLERKLTAGFWVATIVFAIVLILIMTERLHTTAAALIGSCNHFNGQYDWKCTWS